MELKNGGHESDAVLELRGITKRYGRILACNNVDFTLHRGEIHGILGENGAGKSTLMKSIIGLVLPDSGSMFLDGEECRITDPVEATDRGIGMVHQHYSLVDALTVWENVALGERGRLDPTTTRSQVADIAARYGVPVDPDALVRELSAGLRQRVEIIKCLRHEPRIIILDEPTSVLTPTESERLFEVLREAVRREGWAVALVSHKLDEILHATDRITIMRNGEVVQRVHTKDADAPSLATAMVSRSVKLRTGAAATGNMDDNALASPATADESGGAGPVLQLDNLRARRADGAVVLDGLNIEVHPGEIVGVAGVEGNGQTHLAHVLSSLLHLDDGRVLVDGTPVRVGKAGAMLSAGVSVIPADRHHSGCVPEMSVAENLVLSRLQDVSSHGILDPTMVKAYAASLVHEFDIHCDDIDMPLGQLSGGSQQRVVLARSLSVNPKVLIAHQPTRGLDVGAIEYVGKRIRAAADGGIGVLLLSTDLSEIMALSDRIVVIYRGRIVGEMKRGEVDLEQLGLLIGGSTEEAE